MKRQRSTYNLSFGSVLSTVARRPCTRLATAGNRSNRGILMPLLTLGFFLSALSGVSRADQYWVAWEGNDFPENDGWERRVNGVGPAIRTLHDGLMTMDGLADLQIDDYYRMERPLNPDDGEEFIMQWRLRVNRVEGNPLGLYDPGVQLHSDDDWAVSLLFGTDFIRSFHERLELPMQSGMFHDFEFRSSDMRSYRLFVDDSLIHDGSFWEPTFTQSRVQWGDLARGSASLVDWDYFRFGVVPEPSTGVLILALLCGTRALTQSRRMT